MSKRKIVFIDPDGKQFTKKELKESIRSTKSFGDMYPDPYYDDKVKCLKKLKNNNSKKKKKKNKKNSKKVKLCHSGALSSTIASICDYNINNIDAYIDKINDKENIISHDIKKQQRKEFKVAKKYGAVPNELARTCEANEKNFNKLMTSFEKSKSEANMKKYKLKKLASMASIALTAFGALVSLIVDIIDRHHAHAEAMERLKLQEAKYARSCYNDNYRLRFEI